MQMRRRSRRSPAIPELSASDWSPGGELTLSFVRKVATMADNPNNSRIAGRQDSPESPG